MPSTRYPDHLKIRLTGEARGGSNPKTTGSDGERMFGEVIAVASAGGTVGDLRRRARTIVGHGTEPDGWVGGELSWCLDRGFIDLVDEETGLVIREKGARKAAAAVAEARRRAREERAAQ